MTVAYALSRSGTSAAPMSNPTNVYYALVWRKLLRDDGDCTPTLRKTFAECRVPTRFALRLGAPRRVALANHTGTS